MLETDNLIKSNLIAPPPWTLTGSGIILTYYFSKKFILENSFLAPYQKDAYFGLIGSVMLVDYQTSPVGPYFELLFIPGLFRFEKSLSFSISKIYVSSYDSVWNGIQNWGIPKELADFNVSTNGQIHDFEASKDSSQFFKATIQKRTFSFPMSTAFIPLRITQVLDNQLILTKPSAKGKAYFGKVKELKINSALFPDFSSQRLLSTLVVEDFEMKFPVPTVKKYHGKA